MAEGTEVSVEGETRHGIPTDLILEYADGIDADAIVIGKHGDHSEHLGGVGRKLVAESERDVVVGTDG